MLDMTPAKDKTWHVYSNYVGGEALYSIGRKRFENQPLHSGNIEKAYDGKYFTDRKEAEALRDELNRQQKGEANGEEKASN